MSGGRDYQSLDRAFVAREPGSPPPDPISIVGSVTVTAGGLYQVPQPPRGWRPVLQSISMQVQSAARVYDVTLAPRWVCAWIEPESAPDSVGRVDQIVSLTAMTSPTSHVFFFRPAAPAIDAVAIAFRSNGGHGYRPPLDASGRFWALGCVATSIPVGALVRIASNWSVERDPGFELTGVSP